MEKQLRDGLVKSTLNGISAPFEQFYLDSWVLVNYFLWRFKGGSQPQVIDYISKAVVKKVISDLVKKETKRKIKEKLNIDISEEMWEDSLSNLKIDNVGNPLNLHPISSDEYDDSHIKTARTLHKCVILTGDKGMVKKDPTIVWLYGKIRKVHADT